MLASAWLTGLPWTLVPNDLKVALSCPGKMSNIQYIRIIIYIINAFFLFGNFTIWHVCEGTGARRANPAVALLKDLKGFR